MDYYDLGEFSRPVTTTSQDAQMWFDRGLNWLYGYNHAEAQACFERAEAADPLCAMAAWGIAMSIGPNYNLPWYLMDRQTRTNAIATAYAAATRAETIAAQVELTPAEDALVHSLRVRYPQSLPPEKGSQMHAWNYPYTERMARTAANFPEDLEIQTIYLDAILNETPWKMWDLSTGEPGENAKTVEAMQVTDRCLGIGEYEGQEPVSGAWDHPGLLHLHVHLMEMSPHPEAALRSGDRLRQLAPDAGHLVHMPTHIDVLCGNYHDVVLWNQKAVEADLKWREREGYMQTYSLYRHHDIHFTIYGAMFLGQYNAAMAAAKQLVDDIPEDFLRVESPPYADSAEAFIAMKYHVQVRFGRWQDIIDEPFPEDNELYSATTAMLCYAKTVAHSALGNVKEAEAHRKMLREARAQVPDSRRVHNNTVVDLLAVADAMADGELEYRKGNYEVAYEHMREAVDREDNLLYDEPWGWMQPTRHALGALLLEQGHYTEAEAVYRADLGLDDTLSRASQHPNNLWALHGLHECLEARGERVERLWVRQQLDLALSRADVRVEASCFCHQAAMQAAAEDALSCCD